jgi:hypothetical protein
MLTSLACDIDTFRSFVTSEGFTKLYDLPADETEKFLADDTALMLFGFRFLRQVLFGENSINLKKEAVEQRREQVQKTTEQIEREAREKRAEEQDDMYGGQEIDTDLSSFITRPGSSRSRRLAAYWDAGSLICPV